MIPPSDIATRRERGDRAGRAARKRCGQDGRLPDKSTMRGLLGFAQSTPSPEEAVLFIRYQATRQPGKGLSGDQGRFLGEVADEIGHNWSTDIDDTRRFLGILVRAAIVADEENQQRRRGSQGQQRSGQPDRSGQHGPVGPRDGHSGSRPGGGHS